MTEANMRLDGLRFKMLEDAYGHFRSGAENNSVIATTCLKNLVMRPLTSRSKIAQGALINTMSRHIEHVDEYLLAAFLAGGLPARLRQEIVSYIADNDSARDLLGMAREAMNAADVGDGSHVSQLSTSPVLSPRPDSRNVRAESKSNSGVNNLWKVTALFAGAVLVLSITVAILIFDTAPSATLVEEARWSPSVNTESLELSWPAQTGAVMYQILVVDQVSGDAAVLSQTDQTFFLIPGEQTTEQVFVANHQYRLWILAFDVDGLLLSRSSSISVRED